MHLADASVQRVEYIPEALWGARILPETISSIAVLVVIGVNSDGNRELIGAAEGGKEDKES